MNNPMVLALISAIGFGAWPLVSRGSGLSPIWTAITLSVATAMTILAGSPVFRGGSISTKAILIGLVAGLLNGLATLTYSQLISNKEWDISIYIPLTVGLMLVTLAVGGVVFFSESVTPSKVAGIIAILAGVYLLR